MWFANSREEIKPWGQRAERRGRERGWTEWFRQEALKASARILHSRMCGLRIQSFLASGAPETLLNMHNGAYLHCALCSAHQI